MRNFKYYAGAISALSSLAVTLEAQADFTSDSHATFKAVNYYFNSDFRDEVSAAPNQQSKREEWAQGFLFDYRSGYTDGEVGFGVDALGMFGLKLSANADETGAGLLSLDSQSEAGQPSYAKAAHDSYSKLGLTGKMHYKKSELRVGSMIPALPILLANQTRLFPQTFLGGELKSKDFNNLVLTVGQVNKVKQRDSTDYESMNLDGRNGRFRNTGFSDRFYYGGGDYKILNGLTGTYYYSELQDFYRQQYFGLKYTIAFQAGELGLEGRYFDSDNVGAKFGGDIDNQTFAGIVSYGVSGHKITAAYTEINGDTTIPIINGAGTYLPGEVMISNFAEAGEHIISLRYDYDFASMGVPGLTFMTRYLKGTQAEVGTRPGLSGQHEYERDTDIAYAFPKDSALKNVSVMLRNGTLRSNFQRDVDQTRMILSYSLPLF